MPQQWIWGAPGGGVSDHGALTGLADDDHSQYHNDARGDLRYSQLGHNHDLVYAPLSHTHLEADITDLGSYLTEAAADLIYAPIAHTHSLALDDLSNVDETGAADGKVLTYDTGVWIAATPASGVTDHGLLSGLSDDDHLQYHNDTRGDARYSQLGHAHVESDITDLGSYAVAGHTHVEADITDLGSYAVVGHSHTESDISDLGSYAVTGHSHTESDISDLGSYLTEAAADLLYADIVHTHAVPDHGLLSGLADDDHLQYHNDTRGDARYSQLGHAHVESDITDLGSYAVTGHTHVESDITDLGTYLTETAADLLYSALGHTHTESDITDLGSYAVVGHSHTESDISDLGAYLTEAAADLLYADIAHTHSAPDHGALSGLTDDDHTQYALLAGRSGGQTIYGGTASGNSLTLNSTSHATKGDVLLATGGGQVGVGATPDPGPVMHIYKGDSGATAQSNGTVPLVIETGASVNYIQMLTPANQASGIVFADPDHWAAGAVYYAHSTDTLGIDTGATQRVWLNSTGLGVGGSPSYKLDVTGAIRSTTEMYPYGISDGANGAGVAQRLTSVPSSLIGSVHHFTDNTLPASHGWASSGWSTPTTLNNTLYGSYSRFGESSSTPTKHFLYKSVGSNLSDWQTKFARGRFSVGTRGEHGLRFDDGTDNNYAEVYVTGAAADGSCQLAFRYRTGGGSVTTNTAPFVLPCGTFFTMQLYSYYTGSYLQFMGYLLDETGNSVNISGWATGSLSGIFPAAGRAGIFFNNTGSANAVFCDWYHTQF